MCLYNPRYDLDIVCAQVEDEVEGVDDFDDMGLCDQLLRGIYGFGFEKPSMIQQKAIPIALKGTSSLSLFSFLPFINIDEDFLKKFSSFSRI